MSKSRRKTPKPSDPDKEKKGSIRRRRVMDRANDLELDGADDAPIKLRFPRK
jgi:hypothetical protein